MKRLFYLIYIIILIPVAAYSHSAPLDSDGGHYDRKTGEYHYHRDAAGNKLPKPVTANKKSPAPLQTPEEPLAQTSPAQPQIFNNGNPPAKINDIVPPTPEIVSDDYILLFKPGLTSEDYARYFPQVKILGVIPAEVSVTGTEIRLSRDERSEFSLQYQTAVEFIERAKQLGITAETPEPVTTGNTASLKAYWRDYKAAVIVLIIIGVIVLLWYKRVVSVCSSCSYWSILFKIGYCPKCGKPMQSKCKECGKPFKMNVNNCVHCGAKVRTA